MTRFNYCLQSLLLLLPATEGFVVIPRSDSGIRPSSSFLPTRTTRRFSSSSTAAGGLDTGVSDPLGLPPELRKITDAFARVNDDSLRHKQLLYMADNLPLISPDKETPENKVPGCLSTVHIDATATWNEDKQGYVIDYVGQSDGLLTKGLVALLVRGLSGSTAEEIQNVNPEFIQEAQIGQSMTPGRNNGFLNMLAVMKRKAVELTEEATSNNNNDDDDYNEKNEEVEGESSGLDLSGDRPMYNGILKALEVLKPTTLELTDNSAQHAGHAGSKGFNGESHFDLVIVSEAFDGLNLVKRHQLIYMLLGEIMPQIHALKIRANTPEEVA